MHSRSMVLTLRARGVIAENEGGDLSIPELRQRMINSLGEGGGEGEGRQGQQEEEEGGARRRGNDQLLTVNGTLSSLFNAETGLIASCSGFVIGAFVIAQQQLVYGHP